MPFAFRLEHEDGTPAEPATLKTAAPNWRPGDTIPVSRGKILRVVDIRNEEADEQPVLVVEETRPGTASSELTRGSYAQVGAGSGKLNASCMAFNPVGPFFGFLCRLGTGLVRPFDQPASLDVDLQALHELIGSGLRKLVRYVQLRRMLAGPGEYHIPTWCNLRSGQDCAVVLVHDV